MPFIEASGVKVNFPFEPYECQLSYMQKVITCLKKNLNGILESPTGTGKTLCLLCSSLAWLEDKKAQITNQRWKMASGVQQDENSLDVYKESLVMQLDDAVGQWSGELAAPKIIYASRTHSQLTQVVQELKRTAYSHFKVCVLGSREQLCIHPQVMKEENNTTKVHLCRSKVNVRSCNFYNNVDNSKANFTNKVLDVEDLVSLGKKHNSCPYYMSRELKSEADIIFLPYNYLLDPKSRKAHGVELNNNIVIFDEAHNLEKMCEDSASFDWSSSDLASAIRDLDEVSRKISDLVSLEETTEISADSQTVMSEDFTLKDVYNLKIMLHALEKEIDAITLTKPEGISKPGEFIFELFNKADLNFANKSYLVEVLDKMVTYLTSESHSTFQSKGNGLSKFADVIKITFSRDLSDQFASMSAHQANMSKAYKVHICEEKKNKYNSKKSGWDTSAPTTGKPGRVLSYWCFSPGHAMEDLKAQGVKTIILTSGTLSPMSSFTSEMGIDFPIQLENPHVIDKSQVWIGVVGKGPDGTMLSSAYANRFKPEYQSSLGNAIVNFARVVPCGLLLFFPSYPVMDKCLEHWQEKNMWNRVEQYKPIFIEPKGKQDFLMAMENFYDKINDTSGNGACFAAVCRGKVSEGLDFADNNGRAVVITGLPFPPRMDPKVVLKMQYLDEMRSKGGKGLSGHEWYRQQASRAVNQAIGRVIRHKQDYGAIILCDTRFSSNDSKAQLPSWVRPNLNVYNNFGSAMKDMMVFFKSAEKLLPVPGMKKKMKASGDPGCQGAFFEPTLSRSANNVNVYSLQKSSAVVSHVPSLKQTSESGMSLARLKIEYETSNHRPIKAKPLGLLDALSSNNKNHINFYGASPELVVPTQSKMNRQDPVKARKKIIVKKGGNNEVSTDSIQSAEQYLVEVKKTLSTDSYKFFSRTLASYKKTGDYSQMITCLADIFTENPKNYHLFKKFYKFVRSHHKDKFDKSCRELIGEGCGYRAPETTKKRTLSGTSQNSANQEKKLKEDFPKVSTVKTSTTCDSLFQSSDVHLDNKTNLNTAAVSSTISANSISSKPKTATFPSTSTQEKDSPTCDTKNNSKECLKNIKNNLSVINVDMCKASSSSSDNVTVKPNPCTVSTEEAYKNTVQFTMANMEPSGYKCCKCSEDAKVPLKALCHHICCMECWKICIRDLKQCPECKQRVKRKHLQRVCFPVPVK